MHIYTKKQIEAALDVPALIKKIEEGLVYYAKKQTITAPTSFLTFDHPRADIHIKSGSISEDEYYVVKIASGFYENPLRGLPSSNGLLLLFSRDTGALQAILLDEGRLTDVRTAIAGAISAKYMAPPSVTTIGIIGTGTQAREQLYHLQFVTPCRKVLVWGRDEPKAHLFAQDPLFSDFQIGVAKSIDALAASCNLIITTTSSHDPLLFAHQLKQGTHITAVGADDGEKQEIDSSVFDVADLIAVDSLLQCSKWGDLSHAKNKESLVIRELGDIIEHPPNRAEHAITLADLTGIAVEDLQIAKEVYSKLREIGS
jgi:ornithine cyclodeaminase